MKPSAGVCRFPARLVRIISRSRMRQSREAKSFGRATAQGFSDSPAREDLRPEWPAYDTNFKMNPPLRSARDREAVLAGLVDGTIEVLCAVITRRTATTKRKLSLIMLPSASRDSKPSWPSR